MSAAHFCQLDGLNLFISDVSELRHLIVKKKKKKHAQI